MIEHGGKAVRSSMAPKFKCVQLYKEELLRRMCYIYDHILNPDITPLHQHNSK